MQGKTNPIFSTATIIAAAPSPSTSLPSVVLQNKNIIMKVENNILGNVQRIPAVPVIKQEYPTNIRPPAYTKFNNSYHHPTNQRNQNNTNQIPPPQQQQQQQQQQQHQQTHQQNQQSTILNLDTYQKVKTRPHWNESSEARARRLARNAERMRQRRANESEEEYRARLARNAEANRIRRQNETEVQRAIRLMKNAARQRMRRANESPEERARRLAKAAARMRMIRANQPKISKPPLADRLIGY